MTDAASPPADGSHKAPRRPPQRRVAEKEKAKAANTKVRADDVGKFLSSLGEFRDLSAQEIESLASGARFADLSPNQYVTVEGDDPPTHGFIVVEGIMAMVKTSLSGKELIVELLQRGDIFGLLLSLSGKRLPAQLSARSLQKSRVLWVALNPFLYLLKSHPDLFRGYTAHLLVCLQSSYALSRGLAHDRVEVRIAAVLASLSWKFTTRGGGGSDGIKFTRQQLADLTGTTAETAIRVTRAMQHDGIIDIKRPGVIRVLKLDALHALVEG